MVFTEFFEKAKKSFLNAFDNFMQFAISMDAWQQVSEPG